MANNNSGKWFVVCVLEAWSQSGAFKPDLVATLYETLQSYYETISTGTETTHEVGIVWSFCFKRIASKIIYCPSLFFSLGFLRSLSRCVVSASRLWMGQNVDFSSKTLHSDSASLYPMYKWVPTTLMLRTTQLWTSTLRRGSRNILESLHAKKSGISSGLMSHLARMQTLPTVRRCERAKQQRAE